MKKVKTIIASLFIAMASALLGACSCGETEITTINEQSIHIRFVSGSTEYVKCAEGDEIGDTLNITCHLGESFKIEYILAPENTTQTGVTWKFGAVENATGAGQGLGLITPEKDKYYKNNSTVETVTFYAKNRSDTNYQTKLTFTTTLGKEAYAYINVFPAVSDLPALGAPSKVTFDTANNMITWNPITTAYRKGEQLSDEETKLVNGQVRGVYAYELTLEDLDATDDSKRFKVIKQLYSDRNYAFADDDIKDENGQVTDEGFLRIGGRYSATIKGLGDNEYAVDGITSNPLLFSKLAPATNISNNNGLFTFTQPAYSAGSQIRYSSAPNDKFTYNALPGDPIKLKLSDIDKLYAKKTIYNYDLSIICYPDNYDIEEFNLADESTLYEEITDTTLNKAIRYYPSDATQVYNVVRLQTPTLKLENQVGVTTIFDSKYGEFEFGGDGDQDSSHIVSRIKIENPTYDEKFGAKFVYKVVNINNQLSTGDITTTQRYISLDDIKSDDFHLGGQYKVVAQMIGNSSNTIESNMSQELTVLRLDKEIGILNSKITNRVSSTEYDTKSDPNTLHLYSTGTTSGAEFYILGNNGFKKSFRVMAEIESQGCHDVAYNLTELKLEPGEYAVYARLLGFQDSDNVNQSYNLCLTSKVFNVLGSGATFRVASTPTTFQIEADGTVKFNKATIDSSNNYDDYNILIQLSDGDNSYSQAYQLSATELGNGDSVSLSKFLFEKFEDMIEKSQIDSSLVSQIFSSDKNIAVTLTTLGSCLANTIDSETIIVNTKINPIPALAGINYEYNDNGEEYYYISCTNGVDSRYNVRIVINQEINTTSTVGGEPVVETTYEKLGEYTCTSDADLAGGSSNAKLYISFADFNSTIAGILTSKGISISDLQFEIYASQVGSLSSTAVDSQGKLNSYEGLTYANAVRRKVTLDAINNQGVLTWDSVAKEYYSDSPSGMYKIVLDYVGTAEDGITPETKTKTIFCDTNQLNRSGDTFSYNIKDELSKLTGKVVTIRVMEISDNAVSGDYSTNNAYAKILDTPVVERTNGNQITWSAVANVSNGYQVTVDRASLSSSAYITDTTPEAGDGSDAGDGSGEPGTEPVEPEITIGTYPFVYQDISATTFALTDLKDDQGNTLTLNGIHRISVMAIGDTEAGLGSPEIPFVISSVAGDAYVNYVDFNSETSGLKVTVNEDYTLTFTWSDIVNSDVWKNVNETPSVVKYVLSGSVVTDNPIELLTFSTTNPFDGNALSVTLTPSVEFPSSGVIFLGTPSANLSVSRLNAPTIETVDGKLVIVGEPGCKVFIYVGGTAKTNKLETTEYSKVEESGVYTITFANSSKVVVGDNDIYIRLVKDNYLDSKMATPYTVNKLQAPSPERVQLTVPVLVTTGEGDDATTETVNQTLHFISWANIANTDSYDIKYQLAGKPAQIQTIYNRVKGADDADGIYITPLTDGAYSSDLKFIVIDDVCYYLLDENALFGEDDSKNINVGDLYVSIVCKTKTNNCINSDSSDILTLTKLNYATAFANAKGEIEIPAYTIVGSAEPTKVIITIKEVTSTDAKDDTRYTDGIVDVITKDYSTEKIIIDILDTALSALDNATLDVLVQFVGYANDDDYSRIVDGHTTVATINRTKQSTLSTTDGVITISDVASSTTHLLVTIKGSDMQDVTYSVKDLTPAEGKVFITEQELSKIYDPDAVEEIPDDTTSTQEDTTPPEDTVVETFKFQEGTEYTISVVAIDSDAISSIISSAFRVKKLATPTNIRILDGETSPYITWSNNIKFGTDPFRYIVDYQDGTTYEDLLASAQLISHYANGSYYNTLNAPLTNDKEPIDDGYNIAIQVLGNNTVSKDDIGYLTSDYSDNCNVVYINQPTITDINGTEIKWEAIDGAYAYTVTLTQSGKAPVSVSVLPKTKVEDSGDVQETTQSLNIADYSAFDILSGTVEITVTVSIDAKDGIISSQEFTDNQKTAYRPNLVSTALIKDGQLFWKVSLSSIKDYIDYISSIRPSLSGTSLANVNAYVMDYIDNLNEQSSNQSQATTQEEDSTEEPSEPTANPLDGLLTYLLSARLKYNVTSLSGGTKVMGNLNPEISPNKVVLVNQNNEKLSDESAEDVLVSSDTDTLNSNYLAFYYELSNYAPGLYDLQVSANGIAMQEEGDKYLTVLNTRYTTQIVDVFKPTSPYIYKTEERYIEDTEEKTREIDLNNGYLSWVLSTTNASSTSELDYIYNYQIKATPNDPLTTAKDGATVSITIDNSDYEDVSNKLVSRYLKKLDILDASDRGLFTIASGETYSVTANIHYSLSIRSQGNNDKLLNSDYAQVSELMNLLNYAQDYQVVDGKYSWNTVNGASATQLYIYGNYADTTNTPDTETYLQSYINNWYRNVGTAILGDDEYNDTKIIPSSVNEFTLGGLSETGKEIYPAGGYFIRNKQLGNGRGIIDSTMSPGDINAEDIANGEQQIVVATKLGMTSNPNGSGQNWLGKDSTRYVWQTISTTTDGWVEYEPSQGEENRTAYINNGVFVWNPIPGANAYDISVYQRVEDGEFGDTPIWTETVEASSAITVCRYDLPSNLPTADPSGKYYEYKITIKGMRAVYDNGVITGTQNGFFFGEEKISSIHKRLDPIEDLSITGDGIVDWENSNSIRNNVVANRLRVNINEESHLNIEQGTYTDTDYLTSFKINDDTLTEGQSHIQIKRISTINNNMLNSPYTDPLYVWRLASPVPQVDQGVFTWATSEVVSGSNLRQLTPTGEFDDDSNPIYTETTLVDGESLYRYQYYTDVNIDNYTTYSSTRDFKDTTVGSLNFKVNYIGSSGSSSDANAPSPFIIASNPITISNLYKIETPTIEFVEDNGINYIRWEEDDSVLGVSDYRVRLFLTVSTVIEGEEDTEPTITKDTVMREVASYDSDFQALFTKTTENSVNYVKLDITSVITQFQNSTSSVYVDGFDFEDGGQLTVFVQRIGDSTQDASKDTWYLSSSYSEGKVINIPVKPTFNQYNYNNGTLSWTVDNTGMYNIKLTTNYEVVLEDNSLSTYDYWVATSDKIGGVDNENRDENVERYSQIINRTILVETTLDPLDSSNVIKYTLTVSDTIWLPHNNIKTPTEYTLTSIGTKYTFAIVAMVSDNPNNTESQFASAVEYVNNDIGYSFQAFASGVGLDANPYIVNNSTQFVAISSFPHGSFSIDAENDTITLEETWSPIETFTGKIAGNGTKINGLVLPNSRANSAFIVTNKGSVDNLIINDPEYQYIPQEDELTGPSIANLKVATIAINNIGTISNITITGADYKVYNGSTTNTTITYVSGIAIHNGGIISNCIFGGDVIGYDNSDVSTRVTGIAIDNACSIVENGTTRVLVGTIDKVAVTSGSLSGNYVAGIVSTNYGTISNSYVDSAVQLCVTDIDVFSGKTKGISVAGIANEIDNSIANVSITNCYSLATLNVNRESSESNNKVAGFVGYINWHTSGVLGADYQLIITNNYVVVNVETSGANVSGITINAAYDDYTGQDQKVIVEDNYWYTSSSLTISPTSEGNGWTKCDSIETLKASLHTDIYDTTTSYPTLK